MRGRTCFFVSICAFNQLLSVAPLEIQIEPTWQYLDSNHKANNTDSWILIGIINIKKRCQESIILDKLILSWHGEPIDNLLASLYKKRLTKSLVPIEDYLICDSSWNRKNQKLICTFNAPLHLEAYNELCLVLTIPNNLEAIIKKGSFELSKEELPLPFIDLLSHRSFSLAFANL